MTSRSSELTTDLALGHIRLLRAARARVFERAEDHQAISVAVEQLTKALRCGDKLKRNPTRLFQAIGIDKDSALQSAYDRVYRARNIAAHFGAVSRATAAPAIELAITLERKLSEAAKLDNIEHWMTTNPMIAHTWMTVAQVRSAMLQGGFSALPCPPHRDFGWTLVRDTAVLEYLAYRPEKPSDPPSDAPGALKLRDVTDIWHKHPLALDHEVRVRGPDYPITKVIAEDDFSGTGIVLVTEEFPDGPLLGILTPHDLLTI